MNNEALFPEWVDGVQPVDPNVDAREVKRLSNQCAMILKRLRIGPTSNHELATLSLKYTSRISDLRSAGYAITITHADHASGLRIYQLEEFRHV